MSVRNRRLVYLLGWLLCGAVQAAESDELALVIRQLDQVQAALERARVAAAQSEKTTRFYFDYQRATQDISVIKQGIGVYLEPSRAQPILSGGVVGKYQMENSR